MSGTFGIRVMTWENQSGKDFPLCQQGNYSTVFPNTCVCMIELKLHVEGE